jgi:hypothetical protein
VHAAKASECMALGSFHSGRHDRYSFVKREIGFPCKMRYYYSEKCSNPPTVMQQLKR